MSKDITYEISECGFSIKIDELYKIDGSLFTEDGLIDVSLDLFTVNIDTEKNKLQLKLKDNGLEN